MRALCANKLDLYCPECLDKLHVYPLPDKDENGNWQFKVSHELNGNSKCSRIGENTIAKQGMFEVDV